MKNYVSLLALGLLCASLYGQSKKVTINLNGEEIIAYEKSYALVIGISNYSYWKILSGVKNDVKSVSEGLRKSGFSVETEEDLTRTEIDVAINSFIKRYGQALNNRLLIYFAGHGKTMQTSYGDELGYFVPVDAPKPNVDPAGFMEKSLEMKQVEIYAEKIQSKHALFIFDACFAGTIFDMRSEEEIEAINYKTEEQVRQFITSGTGDEQVPDKSIFCQQFITAITTNYGDINHDNYLTGTELGEFLQKSVISYSNRTQHPQYGKIRNPRLDKGDFVFVLPTDQIAYGTKDITTTYGSINLTSEISGKLYLDGAFWNDITAGTQISIRNQTVGKHTLKITGEQNWQRTININSDKTTNVTAQRYWPLELKKARSLPMDTKPEIPLTSLTDIERNTYKVVQIGNQIWMEENLKTTKFNDGTTIPLVTDNTAWAILTTPGYCYYPFYGKESGTLYNWYAISPTTNGNRNICPTSWHVPSDIDWTKLENYLIANGYNYDGTTSGNKIAKSLAATKAWSSTTSFQGAVGSTDYPEKQNLTGFRGLPNGARNGSGSYLDLVGTHGNWWSSTEYSAKNAWIRTLYFVSEEFIKQNMNKKFGYSVRCIKDN